jgi:hypothetical protein
MIRKSNAYKAIDYRDKAKVELALNNKPSNRPSSWIGQAAWELAKRDTVGPPPVTPDPPPVVYKKVAPRVAYKAGGSDARYCCVNQPGVTRLGGGWTDESGATYDDNGLCVNGLRSDAPALTSALEIDGRDYCSLPTTGDPTKNTGSWAI